MQREVWVLAGLTFPPFRQIQLTRKAFSVCVAQCSSENVSQLSCIHKILHLSFKQNGGVHVTCRKWSHIGSRMVGSCTHVAVCDLNGNWRSSVYLRDWLPPAELRVERLPGVVETLSTLVCLDSSHSRRYCYHSRCLCANYQHTGCLVMPNLCPVLLSWVLFVLFSERMLQITVMLMQIPFSNFIGLQCFWPPLPISTPKAVCLVREGLAGSSYPAMLQC